MTVQQSLIDFIAGFCDAHGVDYVYVHYRVGIVSEFCDHEGNLRINAVPYLEKPAKRFMRAYHEVCRVPLEILPRFGEAIILSDLLRVNVQWFLFETGGGYGSGHGGGHQGVRGGDASESNAEVGGHSKGGRSGYDGGGYDDDNHYSPFIRLFQYLLDRMVFIVSKFDELLSVGK